MPQYFVCVGRRGGFYIQVAAPSVDLNQVRERGLHVRLMVRIRCSRMREASEDPRAFAIGDIISEDRSDDPVETNPKQRIYEECGQRPQVPPPLRLPGATIGAVTLDRWVLWCAPMRHFIRRRAGPRKNARLFMPRITHKFAVLSRVSESLLLRGEHPADDMLAHRRYREVAFRHHSNLHATTEKCRHRFDRRKRASVGVGDTESLSVVGFATSTSERQHPH